MYIVAMAGLFAASMFKDAMRKHATTKEAALAASVAERKILEIAAWSRNLTSATGSGSTTLNFTHDWPDANPCNCAIDESALQASSGNAASAQAPFALETDPNEPYFKVWATSWRFKMHVPNRGAPSQSVLSNSMRLVKVNVDWQPDRATAGERPTPPMVRRMSFYALVPEPPRRIANLSVTSTPVSAGTSDHTIPQTAQLSAAARDAEPIDDCVVNWYVDPKTGNATVNKLTGALTCAIDLQPDANAPRTYPMSSPPSGYTPARKWTFTGGTCTVRARTMSDGREEWGTLDVDLGTKP